MFKVKSIHGVGENLRVASHLERHMKGVAVKAEAIGSTREKP